MAANFEWQTRDIVRARAREKRHAGETFRKIAQDLQISVSTAHAMTRTAKPDQQARRTKKRANRRGQANPTRAHLNEFAAFNPTSREQLADVRHFCPDWFL